MKSKIPFSNWHRNALLLLTFIIGFPSLFIIWSFTDDGHSILVSQKMTAALMIGDLSSFLRSIIEPELGRFRPFYWIFIWFTYLIGGTNNHLHRLIHLFVFLAVVYLLFEITKQITKSSKAAFLTGLFFFVSRLNIENWYRLGPIEPRLVLFLLVSVYFLLKSSKTVYFILSLTFLLFSYFTKEIVLAFIPVSFLIWLESGFREKKKLKLENFINRFFVYFLASVIFGVTTRVLTLSLATPQETYASHYQINIQRIIYNSLLYVKLIMMNYGPLFSIACLTFSVRLIYNLKNKTWRSNRTFLWQIISLVWLTSFILIQSPWEYVLPRYFLPASIGLVIFLGVEYERLFEFLDKVFRRRFFPGDLKLLFKLSRATLIAILTLVFIYNGLAIGNYIQLVVNDLDEHMMSFLAKNTPFGSKIYFNFVKGDANLELYYEIPLHFKIFWGREDIEFAHLDFDEKEKLNSGDIIVSGNGVPVYTEEKIATYPGILRIKHFRRKVSNLVTIRPTNIIKRLILFQNPLIGLYSLNHNYYNWYIYQFTNK